MLGKFSVAIAFLVMVTGCGAGGGTGGGLPPVPTPPYAMIAGAPDAVNSLGYLIAQEQRSVVTPGGDPVNPRFSAADQSNFDSSSRLQGIVNDFKNSKTFTDGVQALKTLPTTGSGVTQQMVLARFVQPLYPTWTQNGHVGEDGTTDAGYAVEQEIASALTDAVSAGLQ